MLSSAKVSSQPHGAISLWKSLRAAHVSLQITVLREAGFGFYSFPPFLLVIPAVPGAAELGSGTHGPQFCKVTVVVLPCDTDGVNCHNKTLNPGGFNLSSGLCCRCELCLFPDPYRVKAPCSGRASLPCKYLLDLATTDFSSLPCSV